MRRGRRTTYCLSLTGLFFSSLLVAILVTSIWCQFGYESDTQAFYLCSGALTAWDDGSAPASEGAWVWRSPGRWGFTGPRVGLWFYGRLRSPSYVQIPLWFPSVLIAVPATIAWRRSRSRSYGPFHLTLQTYLWFFGVHVSGAWLLLFSAGVLGYTTGAGHWSLFATSLTLMAFAPLGAFIWSDIDVRRRNRDAGGVYCATCGYNLTGNESGVCPECATEVEQG